MNALQYPMILYILHQKQSLICLKTHSSLKMLSKATTAGQVSITWRSILCQGHGVCFTRTFEAPLFFVSHRWCKSLRSLMLLAAAQAWNMCHGVINYYFQWKLHGLPLSFLKYNDLMKLIPKLFGAVGMTKRSDDHILARKISIAFTQSPSMRSLSSMPT